MKEVVIIAPNQFEIRETAVPELNSEKEVLIQMKAAGVCGSDHHIYHGANPCSTYPRIPGHENAGIVVKAGSEVTRVTVGDHVIVDLVSACGTCYQCRRGRRNVCEQVKVRGSGADGGWREYFTAPEDEVFKIDKSVDWKDAALTEPYAIGAHCTARARLEADDVVLILGAGTIGSIILQTCKIKGCKMIICADIDDDSLARAKGYGADSVINTRASDLIEEIQKITGNKGVTVVFDAACFPGSLTKCLAPGILCNAGRMVPLGFVTEPELISQAMINQRELDIIGSRMSVFQFEATIASMEKNELQTEGIATAFIPLDQVGQVFAYMDHPAPESKKMVILF